MNSHRDYTVAALARFADAIVTLTERRTWASNLRTAIHTVLRYTDLPADRDVRHMHLDKVLDTFARRARLDLAATSVGTYDLGFRRAITRFVAYTDGLESWDRDKRPGQPGGARLQEHTLPLRPGLVVRLRLPADLTAGEARRLNRYIAALADAPQQPSTGTT